MANQSSNNPIVLDTGSTTITGRMHVKQIQWIDDNADIADDADLSFKVNGQTISVKVQLTADAVGNGVIYEAGPFSPELIVDSFELTTIDAGILVLWVGSR